MSKTQENVLIDRDLLSNLIAETSFLVAQCRCWGNTDYKMENAVKVVSPLLDQVTAVINKPRPADGKVGLECPICHHAVDDAGYWDGDRCLKCRLEGIGRSDLANILSKPSVGGLELFVFTQDYTSGQIKATLRPFPRPPDSYLEEMYDARTELPDSGE